MIAAGATKVESLRAELRKAKADTSEQKATAERMATKLTLVKNDSEKREARVAEVQRELKDSFTKCEDPEKKNKEHATELAKMKTEVQEARTETRGARQEL